MKRLLVTLAVSGWCGFALLLFLPATEEAAVASPMGGTVTTTCYGDVDRDGVVGILDMLDVIAFWGDCQVGTDLDRDGWTVEDGDCDDYDPSVNPDAPEFCDGIDNDCNGLVDDGAPCDDGNLCTIDICDNGSCTYIPVDCGDTGNPCSEYACDPATGLCIEVFSPVGTPCSDGDPCTEFDQCDGFGNCSGFPIDCDDGIACTDDFCDPATGSCVNILLPGRCFIDGQCWEDGECNPKAPGECCDSTVDPYHWTPCECE